MDEISVMVADDDELTRLMLAGLITSEPSLGLAGTAADTGEAIKVAEESKPDVVLLDLDMPGGGGFKAAEEIAGRSQRTRIIALTALDTPETQLESMRAGAVSFLVKGVPNEEIVDAIKSAVRWRTEDGDGRATTLEERVAELEQRVAALERAAIQGMGTSD
jgi:DNA-binding NarL/FixJ family response regulator